MINILYNNINCPFCARARTALTHSNIHYKIIDVDFQNKPAKLLELSPKGTVPVFVSEDDVVIDESIDIIRYCIKNSLRDIWFIITKLQEEEYLSNFQYNFLSAYRIYRNDSSDNNSFTIIDNYLKNLNKQLQNSKFIASDKISLIDVMIAPFIEKFLVSCEKKSPYNHLLLWLNITLIS